MLDMKTATIREMQHGLTAVLERVARGEEITITRRGLPVARILAATPVKKAKKPIWPDAMARLNERFPGGPPKGKPTSEVVAEMRGRDS
ncbi:MAG: prevent-host-death protein [Verrucomicrobiales bacterium VVV1]|nr:MAG: prevent-host-death protein [Verrucomicrobiales bacterium VVV1]